MKLSEAIRLGEFALPAAYDQWFVLDSDRQPCGACAVGRTACAVGFDCRDVVGNTHEDALTLSRFFDYTWPWTKNCLPPVPVGVSICTHTSRQLSGRLQYHNHVMTAMSCAYEVDKLSLVEIAEYIETFEPQEVEPVTQEVHEYELTRLPA